MRVAITRRLRAWLLLATFVGTLGLTGLSADHLGIIDIACGAVNVMTSDRAPAVGAGSLGDAQHCPVCHFLRAVSGASVATVARVAGLQFTTDLLPVASRNAPTAETTTRPSRGPPADARPSTIVS